MRTSSIHGNGYPYLYCCQLRHNMIKGLKILLKSFAAAAGIADGDSLGPQPCQREPHGHPVIVVGFDHGGLGAAGINGEVFLGFPAEDSHFPQF